MDASFTGGGDEVRAVVGCAALLVVLSGAGCSAERRVKRVEQQLGAAGLQLEGFRKLASERLMAAACRAGRIERLDALLCSYKSAADLARGHRAAEGWVGLALTGAWADRPLTGDHDVHVLLVLAVRGKVDIEGIAMSRVLAAFDTVK